MCYSYTSYASFRNTAKLGQNPCRGYIIKLKSGKYLFVPVICHSAPPETCVNSIISEKRPTVNFSGVESISQREISDVKQTQHLNYKF